MLICATLCYSQTTWLNGNGGDHGDKVIHVDIGSNKLVSWSYDYSAVFEAISSTGVVILLQKDYNQLTGLRVSDGTPLWNISLGSDSFFAGGVSVAIGNNNTFFVNSRVGTDSFLDYKADLLTGKKLSNASSVSDTWAASAALSNGLPLFGSFYYMYSYRDNTKYFDTVKRRRA